MFPGVIYVQSLFWQKPAVHERSDTHRDRKDDISVASKISNVAVEGHALLCCTSLAHSQGDAKDGISTKLS